VNSAIIASACAASLLSFFLRFVCTKKDFAAIWSARPYRAINN
jgi:hypothetical protein